MKINRRQFHDLIEVYDTVDNHDRQLQPERGEEAKRYGKAPHRADISLHIEFCIAAGTEDAVENGGVDRLCHQVQTAEEKHVLQIFCRGIGKRSEVDDCRRDQHQKTAGHNADGNCKMRQAAAVFACFLEFICTEQVSDQNTGTAAHTADQAGEEALCNRGNRVCCNSIASHVAHDNGVQNVGNSPDEGGRKHGKRVAPEVF